MNILLSHLQAECACAEELLEAMDREQEAMTEGRCAELESISARKVDLLDRMAELDLQREATQMALGFGPGRAGADAAAAASGDASLAAWAGLLVLAERARARNRRNGSMVNSHLDFTRKALHFLHAGRQPFYGPDGTARAASGAGTRLALG
ncbi:FlgN protein [Variovorax sp. SRS16]|uniref:flagella synthesis protein FlgN n=1 Tax=Variovorax sp. SRS16 TaxID=282217 RepID=UPI00131688BD|nr:flagellar protein FlgN [Variovorax sp. SRS16]VTU25569.1 FlgN protein [Variovorax sp. SRS16]